MAAQPSPSQFMSVDEWRTLERNSYDAKHEYIDGQVYLMAGGTSVHARIGSNTVRALEDALGNNPCNAYNSDLAVRLSPTRYAYPDATVTCDERDQPSPYETDIQSPRVIVEVLSNSTEAEAYERGQKFALYRACPTVQEYVLIATRYQAVEVYRRTAQGWTMYQVYGPGDDIELASIKVSFPLAALYRRTTVAETLNAPEGEV